MSLNQNIFPADEGVVPFRLRWDWPWEAGIVDAVREPIAADVFEDLRRRDKRYAGMSLHSYNALKAKWVPPRFVSMFAAIRPNDTAFSRWICCGMDRAFEMKQERGLWKDMLYRLAAANGGDPNSHPLINPLPVQTPLDRWVYPDKALILDTVEGLAAALPWSRAAEYLKLNSSREV